MSVRCLMLGHNNVLIDTVYSPGYGLLKSFSCSESFAEKITLGVTTHIFKCSRCGLITKIEALGKLVGEGNYPKKGNKK